MASILVIAVFGGALAKAAGEGLGEGNQQQSEELLGRFVLASKSNNLAGIQMDAEVEASLPKLKKFGTLSALRSISKFGKITWDRLRFSGDNTIKKEVIARYIQGEQEAQENLGKYSVTPENYRFKYKGLDNKDGVKVHVFHVTPKKKAVGFYKGELWLDPETALPLREAGELVKSPSIFLKKVQFVREYEIVDGQAVPKHVESKIATRVWGTAEVSISYRNFTKVDDASQTTIN